MQNVIMIFAEIYSIFNSEIFDQLSTLKYLKMQYFDIIICRSHQMFQN